MKTESPLLSQLCFNSHAFAYFAPLADEITIFLNNLFCYKGSREAIGTQSLWNKKDRNSQECIEN